MDKHLIHVDFNATIFQKQFLYLLLCLVLHRINTMLDSIWAAKNAKPTEMTEQKFNRFSGIRNCNLYVYRHSWALNHLTTNKKQITVHLYTNKLSESGLKINHLYMILKLKSLRYRWRFNRYWKINFNPGLILLKVEEALKTYCKRWCKKEGIGLQGLNYWRIVFTHCWHWDRQFYYTSTFVQTYNKLLSEGFEKKNGELWSYQTKVLSLVDLCFNRESKRTSVLQAKLPF